MPNFSLSISHDWLAALLPAYPLLAFMILTIIFFLVMQSYLTASDRPGWEAVIFFVFLMFFGFVVGWGVKMLIAGSSTILSETLKAWDFQTLLLPIYSLPSFVGFAVACLIFAQVHDMTLHGLLIRILIIFGINLGFMILYVVLKSSVESVNVIPLLIDMLLP